MSNGNEYARLLNQARMELAAMESRRMELQKQIEELDKRIADHKEGVLGVAKLCDQHNTLELPIDAAKPLANCSSFRDAAMFVLKTSRDTLTPPQVKERIQIWGYDLKKYKTDFLASLHTVLKRLTDDGLIERIELAHGKKGYRWITETEKVAAKIK